MTPSEALQAKLEAALRARLTGSDLCAVIWTRWDTPWGQCLSRPRARVRTTSETDSGLWRTINHREKGGGEYSDPEKALARLSSGHQINLQDQVLTASSWPTPTTRDHKAGPPNPNVPVNGLLGRMVWPTPTSLAPAKDGNNEAGNSAGLVAIREHAMAASWPTPQARDHFPAHSEKYIAQKKAQGHGMANLNDVAAHTNGSSARTEKRVALNPEFVCWLMGFPAAWLFAAPANRANPRFRSTGTTALEPSKASATPSTRAPQANSSPPSSKRKA